MKEFKVVAVHPIHYNDYLFQEMERAGIDITVNYTNKILSNYPWKARLAYDFRQQYCRYFLGVDWRLVKEIVTKRNAVFMVCGWNTFSKNTLFLFLMLFNRRYLVFTDTFQGHVKRTALKSLVRSSWLKLVFSRADKILTTGKVGVSKLRDFYDNEKVINFPFTTDISFFNGSPDFSDFEDMPVLLSSGRLLNSHKGHDVAIRALAKVKKQGYKFRYYIAGVGPDKEMIMQLISDLGMTEEITLLGWQEIDQLRDRYRSAHVFLHTSHFDPFPNSILEAMASGLVVIGSDAAGSAVDRIDNGINGFVFRDGDIAQLTNIIINVLDKCVSDLREISVSAKRVSEKWNVTYNVDIIKSIVNS